MKRTKRKVSHWPGPWTFDESPDGRQDTTIMKEGCPLATVRGTDDMSCIEQEDEPKIAAECVANAKVIAAAPDLLLAAILFKKLIERGFDYTGNDTLECLRVADEAIKKATE